MEGGGGREGGVQREMRERRGRKNGERGGGGGKRKRERWRQREKERVKGGRGSKRESFTLKLIVKDGYFRPWANHPICPS